MGAYQYAFSNQQDFGSPPGFAPQFGGQAYGGQQGFDGQGLGNQQNFGGQPGMSPFNEGMEQRSGPMGGFDYQQNFDGQFDFGDQGFGSQNQPYFPPANQMTPAVPQQNYGLPHSQPGPDPRQRPRNPGQHQSGFGQDQVPFPNSGYLGQ